jgi:CheY-like chemotaxis protein
VTTDRFVMLIDDDDDIRDAIGAILRFKGYGFVGAAGGDEALALLRGGVRPFLIILDLMMPGMSGQQLKALLDADRTLRSIPVVVLSGHGDTAQTAAALGAQGWIRKPIELSELVAIVERYARSNDPPPASTSA